MIFSSLVLALLLYVAFSIYLYSSKSSGMSADAAIVLGAAVWNGKPSPVFQERINHAIKLYQSGQVKKVVFTGGVGVGDKKSEAQAAKEYAVSHGVPARDILLEDRSTITQENLAFSSPLLAANGLSVVLIVSDPLHMKRAMTMADDLGLNALPSPTETSRYQSYSSRGNMLFSEMYFYIGYKLRHF
ncbi:MAG: YdcF family protein [Pseudomonadales bacterium]|nr:YdcF family protein [Pseudomonadales bacterium]